MREAYEPVCELRRLLEWLIRPGVRACDVYQVGAGLCEGIVGHRPGGFGHGLGIECHEPPVLTPYDETVLEEGMTIVIELGGGADGISFLLEDGGLVTPDGWKSLTGFGIELVEIK